MMTINKTLQVMKNERECIRRQIPETCDRDCANCDLLLPTEDVLEAFNTVVKMLEEERRKK